MRVRGVRRQCRLTSVEDGDTHMRSRAKIGNFEGNVRTSAVFPNWVWIQRSERPVGSHSLKSLSKMTTRVR